MFQCRSTLTTEKKKKKPQIHSILGLPLIRTLRVFYDLSAHCWAAAFVCVCVIVVVRCHRIFVFVWRMSTL